VKISDADRTKRLNDLGFEVLRFANDDVLYRIDDVINAIYAKLSTLPDKETDQEERQLPFSLPPGRAGEGPCWGLRAPAARVNRR
jgi:hypothetical protein